MTGWIVFVRTERLGGGAPMSVGYATSAETEADAIDLVRKELSLTNDEDVGVVAKLSEETTKRWKLMPRQVILV